VSLGLRTTIVLLLVLALAGTQWVRASNDLSVVFLLDVSDSVDLDAREQAVGFVRAALADMGPDDRAALVLFGADALVERPMSQAKELGELLSIPATTHTDAGEALRLGLALLPATARRRIVLLSDGQLNVPGTQAAAQLAGASGVELDVVPLPAQSGDEAWLDAVQVPGALHAGETFGVIVRVQSLVSQPSLVRLYANGTLVGEEAVRLHPGLNTFAFDLAAGDPGVNVFSAQLVPRDDVYYQNNVMDAFSLVRGPPRVLVVSRPAYPDAGAGQEVDDARQLILALEQAGLDVDRVAPPGLPVDLASLADYAAIVLANVPAPALSPRQMDLLQSYVRDLGRGLVCVGGQESYGVGGYYKTPLEETLPVEMTIKDRDRMPPLALVFAIDKSGSMGAAAAQGGTQKIGLAKEAILRSLELLNPSDRVGVVAFEGTAQWVWPLAELDDLSAVQGQVATLRASGGTDIYAGLNAAVDAISGQEAQLKHVILLTDGGASQDGLADLVARLRLAGGTLSVVGIGQDSASFLQPLAIDGGGRYHYTDNPATIPQIFVQETSWAQRAYLVEETFYPSLAGHSPIVEGIESVPVLYGYVATSIKPAAQMVLASGLDDPVLAQWQYGLGRSVAWTSDATGRWAVAWMAWDAAPRFWAQAVRWTIVARDDAGLETRIVDLYDRAHITVDAVDEEGDYGNALDVQAHLVSPSLEPQTVLLQQTAPGRYEGDFSPRETGVYLVRVEAGGQDRADPPSVVQMTGFVRTYSPEYRTFGTDLAALRRLAELGSGAVLDDPAQVFARRAGQDVVRNYTDVWPWLLAVAVCLLPLDVGLRRVIVDWGDVSRAIDRARARFSRPEPATARSERMARLMSAKDRAPAATVQRTDGEAIEDRSSVRVEEPSATSTTPVLAGEPGREGAGMSLASRLLAAKRQAQSQGTDSDARRSEPGAEDA
jgi:uncharacterized membrane protein